MMENEQLVAEIRRGINRTKNLEILYEQNTGFTRMMCQKYSFAAEVDDLMQEAYFALVNAVNTYIQYAGANFLTWYGYCLRTRFNRLINRGSVPLPTYITETLYKLDRASESLQKAGREPSIKEVASAAGVAYELAVNALQARKSVRMVSLDAPVEGSESDRPQGETVPDPTDHYEPVEEKYDQDLLADQLWFLVDAAIPKDKADILRRRYKEGLTLTQIAKDLGKSTSRINAIHGRCLRDLKRSVKVRKLYEAYRNEVIDQYGYRKGDSTPRSAIKLIELDEMIRNRSGY